MNVNFDRLSKLPALSGFSPEEMTEFFRIATKHQAQPGDVLMKAGDKADCFYLVAGGTLEIVLSQGSAAVPIATLSTGQLVGEMPLLYSQPLRQADVVVTSDAILLRFAYDSYHALAEKQPLIGKKFRSNLGKIVAGRVWSTLPETPSTPTRAIEAPQKAAGPTSREAMKKAGIFAGFDEEELERMEAIALPITLDNGQIIVKTGEPATSFYLISHGFCEVQLPKDGTSMPVARLGAGQVFGEMALVYKQPARTADVVAVSEVKLLNFPFDDYNRLAAGVPSIGRKLRNNLGRVAASRSWTMQN